MEQPKLSTTNENEIVCKNCAAKLVFAPGTSSLKCEFCGTQNEIVIDKDALNDATREIDFLEFIRTQATSSELMEVHTVKCASCGASTTFDANVVSSSCDFCAAPMVTKQESSNKVIKPKAVLPFKIDTRKSLELFRTWIKKLWWAPNDLKKKVQQNGKLAGMYLPYWTYDALTESDYTGERGDDYQETESYTEDGETKTRTVTKTRWTWVSGSVRNDFDDVFVVASKSLPEKYVDALEPWNLNELVPYNDQFLSGFKTETYQVNVEAGFDRAKEKMDVEINRTIRNDIGGDHQRISSKNTSYDNITFKHILLPVWISAYRYKTKVYRFMVNGQTGEVQGERPYSWIKITLAILAAIGTIALLYYFFGGNSAQ